LESVAYLLKPTIIVVCYCFYYRIDLGFGQNAYPRWVEESKASSRRERVDSEGARLVLFVLDSRFRGVACSEQGANKLSALTLDHDRLASVRKVLAAVAAREQ